MSIIESTKQSEEKTLRLKSVLCVGSLQARARVVEVELFGQILLASIMNQSKTTNQCATHAMYYLILAPILDSANMDMI